MDTTTKGRNRSALRWQLGGLAAALLLSLGAMPPALAAKKSSATTNATASIAAQLPAYLDKLASDLLPLVASPATLPVDASWAKSVDGKVLVKVLIVGASTDAELTSMRADVLARGGSVFYNYVSVRALSAMLPASALAALAARSDVLAIAPNRATQRQASLVQMVSGAGDALPGAGTSGALDGRGVGIAVLDSGIDFRHRNLQGADGKSRVRAAVDIVSMGRTTFLDDGWTGGRDHSPMIKMLTSAYFTWTGGASSPLFAKDPDAYGHGTAVAAVAAGAGGYQVPDSSGIATGADLYDVRVLNEQGVGNIADVLAGIDWVIQRSKLANIRVMNMSLGAASTDSFLVDPLARAARSAVAAGIVVVVSSGNAGKDESGREVYGAVASPGHEPSVITVGANNMVGTANRADDVMATFSSRGPTRGSYTFANGNRWTDNLIKPDLVAPGNKVLTASGADSSGTAAGLNLLARTYPLLTQVIGASQAPGQALMTLSGTSIAAPAVSGAAAVLLQANPGLTPPLIKAILQYTATPLANANLLQQGTGLLNLEGAVRLAKALRTDIAPAVAAGSIKPGDSLLATGMTLPVAVSTISGKSVAWSRVAYAGGTHLVRGDALFNAFQPIWDPALTWARHYALRSTISYLPGSGKIPANTVPSAIVERNASAQALLTPGVRLLDGVALSTSKGAAALMTPLATLIARADAGTGYTLGIGFSFGDNAIRADGFTLSQGFILNDGFILRDGYLLNEGFILRDATGDVAGNADRSFYGD